jgi:NAD-dependent dihydropyrimidine dehydrogenase PreA subunit
MLDEITKGNGKIEDIKKLEELALMVKNMSLCGLGQTAPNPLLTTIKYFRNEYEAHIVEKRCPAHVCLGLITFLIHADKCKRCGLCTKNCPTNCISGDKNTPYVIDQSRCVKCGTCVDKCPFKAITKE